MNVEIKKNRCLNGGGRSTNNEARRFSSEELGFDLEINAWRSRDINLIEVGGRHGLTATFADTIFKLNSVRGFAPRIRY